MRRATGVFAATASATGALLISPGVTPSASATDCLNAEVIFARGTSEPPGIGRVGEAFVDSLRQDTGQDVGVYAVNYPAGLLQRGGNKGAKDAISHIKSMAETCPNTKLVLGGYSQGATVIDILTGVQLAGLSLGDPLPAEYAGNVAAVAVFGNAATRTGGPISSQSQLFASKAIDLCNPGDPICHAGPGNEWSDHTEGYVPAFTSQAANFVAARIPAAAPLTYAPTDHVI